MSDEDYKKYDPNPASVANNQHHNGGYRSEQDYYEDLLGKGDGDPDFHGYPERDEVCDTE